jgi:hypothetical protein
MRLYFLISVSKTERTPVVPKSAARAVRKAEKNADTVAKFMNLCSLSNSKALVHANV